MYPQRHVIANSGADWFRLAGSLSFPFSKTTLSKGKLLYSRKREMAIPTEDEYADFQRQIELQNEKPELAEGPAGPQE